MAADVALRFICFFYGREDLSCSIEASEVDVGRKSDFNCVGDDTEKGPFRRWAVLPARVRTWGGGPNAFPSIALLHLALQSK